MLRAARRIDPQRSGAHSALLYRALSLQAGEMFGELSVLRIEVVSGCTLTCTTPQCKRPQLVAISSFGCSAIVAIDTSEARSEAQHAPTGQSRCVRACACLRRGGAAVLACVLARLFVCLFVCSAACLCVCGWLRSARRLPVVQGRDLRLALAAIRADHQARALRRRADPTARLEPVVPPFLSHGRSLPRR